MSRTTPPLWTWAATLVLAALLLGGAQLAVRLNRHRIAGDELNLARLAALPPHADYVAIVGSSKIGCAVAYDDQMEALLRARGAPVSVVKIGKPEGEFADFAEAFDAMARRPPKLLLLDMDFFVYEPRIYRAKGQAAESGWRKQTRDGLAVLFGIDRARANGFEFNYPASARRPCPHRWTWGSPQDRRRYAAALADRRVTTPGEREAELERLRVLQAKGTTVALLEVPRSPAAAGLFPARLERGARDILDNAATPNRLVVLDAPPSLPAELFFDPGHLGVRGQAVYSAWLAAQVAAILARGSDA